MPITKLKNGQLPDTISSKTVDNTNDINTTTTRLKITGGSNGQVLSTDGSGNLSWTTAGGGGGISDGDKGDVTVSGSGTTWTIDNDAVTYAKIQNVSTTSRLLGRASAGAGDVEEITIGSGLSLSGTTISASGGTGSPTAVVMKTVDESTSSSNPQNDDHLFYTFVSGKTYYVELNLLVSRVSAGSAQGILIVFNAGAGNGYWRLPSSATSSYFQVDGASGTSVAPALLAGVPYPVKVFISIKPTATVVGNFQFGVTSTGGPLITVHKGSHMNIWEVA